MRLNSISAYIQPPPILLALLSGQARRESSATLAAKPLFLRKVFRSGAPTSDPSHFLLLKKWPGDGHSNCCGHIHCATNRWLFKGNLDPAGREEP